MIAVQKLQQAFLARHCRALFVAFLVLRVALGLTFLESGLDKVTGVFDASGFLANAIGPFAGFYRALAPFAGVINPLVGWGELLIGLGLVFGALLRPASFFGAIVMLLFYLPYLPPRGLWVNQQVIFLIVFAALVYSGAGYYLGLDAFAWSLEERRRRLRYLFG